MEELQRFLNIRKFHSEFLSAIFEILEKFWMKKRKFAKCNEIINGTEISGTKHRSPASVPGLSIPSPCLITETLWLQKTVK